MYILSVFSSSVSVFDSIEDVCVFCCQCNERRVASIFFFFFNSTLPIHM